MTNEVLVSISGLGYEQDSQKIESVSTGKYSFCNGKHFVQYEELLSEDCEVTETASCLLKFTDSRLEVIKKGRVGVHMFFELNQNHMTSYATPYGDLMLGITTKAIQVVETEGEIAIDLKYSLDVNYQYVSDCDLKIKIKSK